MRARRALSIGLRTLAACAVVAACAGDEAAIDGDDGRGGYDPGAGDPGDPGTVTTTVGAGGAATTTGAGGAATTTGAGGAATTTGAGGAATTSTTTTTTTTTTTGAGGAPPVCAAGTADCDGAAANGCEATLASDVANCGACGHACATVHGKPSCKAGACSSACGVKAGKTVQTTSRAVAQDDPTEAALDAPAGHVITGLGVRVNSDDVRTLRLRVQPVVASGELGAPKELRAGDQPQEDVEANVDLPPCYVLVGVGARSNSDDAKTLRVWGAPLLAGGALGAPEPFFAGSQPNEDVEVEAVAPAGRALTGVGFRVKDDNFVGLRVVTDAWQAQ